MKTRVIIETELLEKKVSELLKATSRHIFEKYNIEPDADFFRELDVRNWEFESFLTGQATITTRDYVNEAAFHIIQALHLQPKLDEVERAWCYTFPQEANPHQVGVLCGFGNTIDQAARAFLLNMQFSADGGNTAFDYMEGKRIKENEKKINL